MGLAPPPSQERRSELTDFLRNRRAQVTPQDVGLPANGRRRTPGLRREEVAQLAGVGLSWYTWLEQGRDIKPSAQVLDALARVLRLDTAERAHLFHLARVELPLPAAGYPREAPPDLAHFVARVAPYPAYLIGPRTDVLAWNARRDGDARRADAGAGRRQNLLWWLFTSEEPLTEQRRATARSTLARFRAEQARRIGDPGFAALVDALDQASEQFRAWWPRHEVLPSSWARRPSSIRASGASCCTTCNPLRRATRTCASSSSRPPTKRRATRSLASSPQVGDRLASRASAPRERRRRPPSERPAAGHRSTRCRRGRWSGRRPGPR